MSIPTQRATDPARNDEDDKLLTPGEVAALFRVDTKTVARWAKEERIPSIKTPGGHRRYWKSRVMEILNGQTK